MFCPIDDLFMCVFCRCFFYSQLDDLKEPKGKKSSQQWTDAAPIIQKGLLAEELILRNTVYKSNELIN